MEFGSTYTAISMAIPKCTDLFTCALTHSLRLDYSMPNIKLVMYVCILYTLTSAK